MISTREAFVERIDLPDPADARRFARALAEWRALGRELLGVLVKTPGNGLTNDFSRPLALGALQAALAGAGAPMPVILASGGTEGVGVPHLVAFGRGPSASAAGPAALAIGCGAGAPVAPAATGTGTMARATAAAVRAAMADAGIARPSDVTLAIVKAPLRPAGALPLDEAGYARLKGRARGAAALGAGEALGDLDAAALDAALERADGTPCCPRVLVSAGTDEVRPQALVFGRAAGWTGSLAVGTTVMADMLDSPAVAALLARLGLPAAPQLAPRDGARLRAVLAKGELPRVLRGTPLPSAEDSDIHPNRHFRAAIGGVLGSLLGDGRIYLSGGAEHQVPPGAVLVAVIAEQNRGS